ncbi:MAG: pyrrolo-quinoline quinone [Rhodospirillaceae bacterium]|nr:pyrrolo-quinoline quinone [Rhodospirillaceae bacterium]OUT78287.1 MAG: hypothetical protein CBB83_06930 [Rhodospirillaceae bacterium TMED23]
MCSKIKFIPHLKITLKWITFFSAFMLVGCDTFIGVKGSPPLPGKRVSILIQERIIKADKTIINKNIVLPSPSYNSNWPQTGGYPNHAMHHMQIGQKIRKQWTINIGTGSSSNERLMAQPIISNDHLYTMDTETNINAHNIDNGNLIWRRNLTPKYEENHINGGLAYLDGNIFVTTGIGKVIALDSKLGITKWEKNLFAPLRVAPTARDGRVFVITITNKVYALDSKTGNIIWSNAGIEETTNFLGGASPAVENGVVIAPFSSGEIIAFKVENGQELWRDSISSKNRSSGIIGLSAIRGHPVIDRGIVFAISNARNFIAVNLRTGRRIWSQKIGGIETPWVAGNYIFILSNNNELVAFERATGRIHWTNTLPKWRKPVDRSGRIIWTGPLLASDRLIVANSIGEALSISPYNGKILGKIKLPDAITISPIIAKNTLFFLSDDAELTAFR